MYSFSLNGFRIATDDAKESITLDFSSMCCRARLSDKEKDQAFSEWVAEKGNAIALATDIFSVLMTKVDWDRFAMFVRGDARLHSVSNSCIVICITELQACADNIQRLMTLRRLPSGRYELICEHFTVELSKEHGDILKEAVRSRVVSTHSAELGKMQDIAVRVGKLSSTLEALNQI